MRLRHTGSLVPARLPLALCLSCVMLAALAARADAGGGTGLRFRTEIVRDPMSNGIEAFRMLVPTGWVRRGGVLWNLRYSNVASVAMTVTDARSHQELQAFPLVPQVWDPGRFLGAPGASYLGMEVRQPVSATALIEADRACVPRQPASDGAPRDATAEGRLGADRGRPRPGHLEHVRRGTRPHRVHGRRAHDGGGLLRRRLLHDLAGAARHDDVAASLPLLVQGAAREARRRQRGCCRRWSRRHARASSGTRATSPCSTSGSKARCRRSTPPASSASRSRPQATRSAGRRATRGGRNRTPTTASTASCRTRSRRRDLREPVRGRTVELPNDYRYAWVFSSDQYALSDSAGFDPNVGATVEWRLLRVAR